MTTLSCMKDSSGCESILESIVLEVRIVLLLADGGDDLAEDHGRCGLHKLLFSCTEEDGEIGGHVALVLC